MSDDARRPARAERLWRLALLLILLLAAGLRFYRLDAQSFWNDEGNSARLAERSVRLILEGAAGDIHPPLYYLALHVWRAVLGDSEFALRAFSAVGGVGLVALIYALGRHFLDPAAALAAAFFAAVNPFQVYYSQEARSYIWIAFLGAAVVYAADRLLESKTERWPWRWIIIYGAAAAAGLYTHYLFPLVLLPVNLVALVVLLRKRSFRELGVWIGLQVAVLVLYLPWLPIAWRQLFGWPSSGEGAFSPAALLEAFSLLGLGSTVSVQGTALALLGFGLLALLGFLPARGRRYPWLPVAWLLLPLGLILALGLFQPAFAKFLLVVSPAFCLLLARGLTNALSWPTLRRAIFFPLALALGLMLSFSYESLHNLYFDPAYARADYRGMAAYIESVARPDDAVILNAANQWEVFTYYYPHVERTFPLPRSRPPDPATVESELADIVADHSRVFAIFWAEVQSDPQRLVERWLDDHAYKAADKWWSDVRLVTYAVPAEPATEIQTSLDVRLGESIRLQGYTLLQDQVAPGDIVQVTLFWEALEPIDQRYKVFVQLLRPDGSLLAQHDSEPGGGLALTTTWQLGEVQRDNHGVLVPAGAEPGTYTLIVGLYPLDDPTTRLTVWLDGYELGKELDLSPILVSN